jgi:hypothetical protein
MTTTLRLIAALALLALGACESLGIDPIASIGNGLKDLCRPNNSCTVHQPDPGRQL